VSEIENDGLRSVGSDGGSKGRMKRERTREKERMAEGEVMNQQCILDYDVI
jgi:hypothetical protein